MGTVVFPVVPCGVEVVYGVVEVTPAPQRCRSTLATKNLQCAKLMCRSVNVGVEHLHITDILYVDSAARAVDYAQAQARYEPSSARMW